jgi:hypothetical protein
MGLWTEGSDSKDNKSNNKKITYSYVLIRKVRTMPVIRSFDKFNFDQCCGSGSGSALGPLKRVTERNF